MRKVRRAGYAHVSERRAGALCHVLVLRGYIRAKRDRVGGRDTMEQGTKGGKMTHKSTQSFQRSQLRHVMIEARKDYEKKRNRMLIGVAAVVLFVAVMTAVRAWG